MTTAAATFRFEIERPDLPDKDKSSGYSSSRSIYSKPRVECDLCPSCIDAFTDWFTEFDEEISEPAAPNAGSESTGAPQP